MAKLFFEQEMEPKAKKSRRSRWNGDDEDLFLSCWEKYHHQIQKCQRNTHVYESISADMDNKFTAEEIRIKIKNFSQRYRQESRDMDPFEENPPEWRHYAYVHRIISNNSTKNSYEESFKQENSLDISETSEIKYSGIMPMLPITVPSRLSLASPTTTAKSFTADCSASLQTPEKVMKSSCRKRKSNDNTYLEVLAAQGEEHLALLRKAMEDNKAVSKEIVELLRKQKETDNQMIDLLKKLVDKN